MMQLTHVNEVLAVMRVTHTGDRIQQGNRRTASYTLIRVVEELFLVFADGIQSLDHIASFHSLSTSMAVLSRSTPP